MKPANLVVGNSKANNNILYLIDFGLSKRFRNEKTGEHNPYLDGKQFIGNARFASIYSHLGIDQSRRDDLISLSFIIAYFYKGSLPWQGLKCKTQSERNHKVFQKKFSLAPEEIFKGVPSKKYSFYLDEFLEFYYYCCNLHFDEKPDYKYLKSIVNGIAKKENFIIDNIFDWNLLRREEIKLQSAIKTLSKSETIIQDFHFEEFSTFIN